MPTDVIPIRGFAEPFSSLSHFAGAAVFLLLSYFLIRRGRGDRLRVASLVVFSVGAVGLLSISGTYHSLDLHGTPRHIMQVLDHAAIFILIAATFTPVHIIIFHGWGRWGILALVWVFAITAISLKSIYFDTMPHALGLSLYLIMGWIGAYTGISIWRRFGFNFMRPILLGGIAYSLGALMEFAHWPIPWHGVVQSHEVFHIAVLIGLGFHWALVYRIADGRFSTDAPTPPAIDETCPQPAPD